MQQNKVKKKVLMAPQKTKDLLNQSFEKCFEELSEGLDMGKFMSNIKTLANNEKEKPQQQASMQSLDKKENIFKQEYFESVKQQHVEKEIEENVQTKKLKPIIDKKPKTSEEVFQKRLQQFNKKLEKILDEKVNSRKKKPKRCNSQFYERMQDYKNKKQQKLEVIRKEKETKQENQYSFKPKINKNQQSQEKYNFLEKMLLRSQERQQRCDDRKKNYEDFQKEVFEKSCTFKPKINKSHSHSRRNIDDLIQWKNQIEQKRQDQKEFFQEKFTFKPKITKKSKLITAQKSHQFSNPGERLYREFLTKKYANQKAVMEELKVDYESLQLQNQAQQSRQKSKSFEKKQLDIIKKKMNVKKRKTKKNDAKN